MSKALKNIGFFLVTIVIAAVIFWLVFVDKQSKQGVLEYSLGLLGEKLMAMVPESEDKQPIQTLYDDFVAKAKNQEVAPDKIENVAATILNLSNRDTIVTPQEAEAIIRFSLAEPVRIERAYPESVCVEAREREPRFVAVAPLPPPKGKQKLSPEQWIVVGERIKTAYDFNSQYQKAMQEYHKKMYDPKLQMQFKVEDGLRIDIDTNLKQQLDQKQYHRLQKEMQELEKKQIIVWRKNFSQEMQKELEKRRQEIESLKQLNELENLTEMKGLESLQSLKALESLKSLEVLQYIPVINADSIRIIVEKSLKEAGVAIEKGKK
ncbi:MAG: hypothetical protein MUC94_07085 [bacterium]|nr:hypothetical protein [bacterium]